MSILSLHQVSLKLAETTILDNVQFSIDSNHKIAMVGRNGCGKSTFMKMLLGELLPDSGVIQKSSTLKVASLIQEVPAQQDCSVFELLVKSLKNEGYAFIQYRKGLDTLHEVEDWDLLAEIDIIASHLKLPLDASIQTLSGGQKRRVLLGAALLAKPDLLLLDEPTNHLDIPSIEWLETYLSNYQGAVILVTHDRRFLQKTTTKILELDRGQLQLFNCNYEQYLARREANLLAEEKQNALFDKNLAKEEAWIRQGIEARRTRNEGRVRRLKAMREAFQQRIQQQGQIKHIQLQSNYSSQQVLEAKSIDYAINGQTLIKNFSLLLMRGSKIGIIGPNGCGKTTLVRLLLKELTPSQGSVTHSTTLQVAYFDQLRAQLVEKDTVMNNVADGAEFVDINGQKKHVASYLKEFLFTPERFNQPVFSLSGGEKNRLLLAKLLAKPVNLLVMDEPTNDLDMETLERLEDMLLNYSGTILLISHDREFIDRTVESVIVYEGNGRFGQHLGGYQEYVESQKNKPTPPGENVRVKKQTTRKLTYQEQRELEKIPSQLESLELERENKIEEMSQTGFYQKPSEEIVRFNTALAELEAQIKKLYERWEFLEDI